MSRISYLIKRVFSMNHRQMFAKIKEVKERSGRSYIYIVFDMLNCGVKYQAGYMDYALFEMYNLNSAQRKTVVTRGINNGFIKRFNNPEYIGVFEDKRRFNSTFSDFLHRAWIDAENATDEELDDFLKKNPQFIAKPAKGMCGKGIEKLNAEDFGGLYELKAYLRLKELSLLEEVISQHSVMSELHPECVNTCRVITLLKDGKAHVVAAYLRIGNGKFVDNFNSGGMVVPIEEDRGEVLYPAINKKSELFEVHPLTGTPIKGFKVPDWNSVTDLVTKAAAVIPQVGLVGWDIALTEKCPVIIEGNDFPGHDIYGLPPHRKDGIGVLPKFEKIIQS